MNITLKRLSLEMVEGYPEVQLWLNQFSNDKRATAIALLLKLQFVTRDTFSEWLKAEITGLPAYPCALYAVRKFGADTVCIWDETGEVAERPGSSLGSEDLVQSTIANLVKSDDARFLDNPSLKDLKRLKVHDVVLIDDSIGSGDRVCDFIHMIMKSKTFLSWWSYGWIFLHILAFARTNQADKRIIESLPGSDHPLRKHPKSRKVSFHGHITHHRTHFSSRWGSNFQDILDLCRSQKAIPFHFRLGYGETMANIVFYHSVPDNIPGMLWYGENKKWTALFPNRSVPEWLPQLLDSAPQGQTQGGAKGISKSLLAVLQLVKKGIRNKNSLARSLGLDVIVLRQILSHGRDSGFLTEGNRLTEAGLQAVLAEKQRSGIRSFDRALYIPKKWRVGQGTVQPSGPSVETHWAQTDSTNSSLSVGGETGQASLERTDAKTASPSLSVMPQKPSKTRMGHDTYGPEGWKER